MEDNSNIQTTLNLFREIERLAPQAAEKNWRIQLALYRAWLDSYQQRRVWLLRE